MLLSIIPLDSSIDDEGLTYFAQDSFRKDIFIGSLVNIPIRDNICYGIVADILPKETETTIPENLKSIVNIVCTTPLLAPYQFSLVQALASKNFVHAHKVLSLFLPKFVFNALEKKTFEPMLEVTRLQSYKVTKNSRNPKPETRNLISFFHNTKNIPLVEIIQFFLKKYENLVIIFPDDLLLSQTLKNLPELQKKSTIVKNSATYTKRYKTWLEASKKTNPILAWTRKLLQYNLGAYEKIIYIEESLSRYTHSYEHIYKNTDILAEMSHCGFDVTIYSTVPTTESMYAIKQRKYSIFSL